MRYLFLTLYFASFAAVFANLGIIILTAIKARRGVILLYLAMVLLQLVFITIHTIELFCTVFLGSIFILDSIPLRVLHHTTVAALLFVIPLLAHHLAGRAFRWWFGVALALPALFCLSLIGLPWLFTPVGRGVVEFFAVARTAEYALILAALVYCATILYHSRLLILRPDLREVAEYSLRMVVLLCALLFIEVLRGFFWPWLDWRVSSFPPVFLVWNVMGFILTARLFILKAPPEPQLIKEIPAFFMKQYAVTAREKEIIMLLARGLVSKEISVQLDIAEKTVRNHIHNIYQKLQVQGRFELLMKILEAQE